jgi:hypothetical protein
MDGRRTQRATLLWSHLLPYVRRGHGRCSATATTWSRRRVLRLVSRRRGTAPFDKNVDLAEHLSPTARRRGKWVVRTGSKALVVGTWQQRTVASLRAVVSQVDAHAPITGAVHQRARKGHDERHRGRHVVPSRSVSCSSSVFKLRNCPSSLGVEPVRDARYGALLLELRHELPISRW